MAKFEVGSFLAKGSVGVQTITLNTPTLTPKALVLWTAPGGNPGPAAGTWASHPFPSIGFTDGTNSYSVAMNSQDAITTSNTNRRIAAKAFTQVSLSGTASQDADLDSFAEGSFALDWTTVDYGNVYEIMYLAIGGDDVTAEAGTFNTPTSTGTRSVVLSGAFQPDLVMFATAGSVSPIPSSTTWSILGFGAMDASGNQFVNGFASEDNVGTSNTARFQNTASCIGWMGNTTSLAEIASFWSMNADGFTVNFTTAHGSAWPIIYLALSGIKAKVGALTSPSATGNQSYTGIGFEPETLLDTAWGYIASTSIISDADWSLGAFDGTRARSVALNDEDALTTTDANSVWLNNKTFITPAQATTMEEGEVFSLDINGFTVNWTKIQADARQHCYIALATDAVAPDTPTNLAVTSTTLDTTPTFSADISDPNTTQQIKARFEVETAAGVSVGSVDSTLIGGSHTATAEYASALALGEYRVRAKTIDDGGLESSYADYVYFSVRQAVAAPDLELPWQVGVLVGLNLELLWDVFLTGRKDLELIWNTAAYVSEDLELLWSQKTPWDRVTNQESIWVKVDD